MNNEHITIVVHKKHNPWANQMKFTPRPKTRSLIEAMNDGQEHLSETINYILEDYFSSKGEKERFRLLAKSKHHY